MAGKKGTKTDFKAKAKAAASRSAAKRKNAAPKKTRRTKSEPNLDTSTNADPESNDEVSDDDVAFVEENASSLNFLSSIDPTKLAAFGKEEKKKKKTAKVQPKPKQQEETADSEDDIINDYSDSDLEIHSDDDNDDEAGHSEAETDIDDDDSVVDFVLSDSDTVSDSDPVSDLEEEPIDKDDDYVYRNSKMRRAEKRKALLDEEMDYEQQTRSFEQPEKKAKVSNRLPIKTSDGRLVAADSSGEEDNAADKEGKAASDSDDDVEMGDAQSDSDSSPEPQTDSEPEDQNRDKRLDYDEAPDRTQMSRKQYIVSQQNRLATIADMVMQNLEANMSGLKYLHAISDDKDPKVKQLGLLTQLAVYRDILPDYRIRDLTEKEKQTKVTREVRQQRIFEERLVKYYSTYLKQLFATIKHAMKIFGDSSADIETGTVATRALGDLINTHPHFNFRKDLIAALVDIYVQPSSRINFAPFTPMAQIARLAILRLFRDDVSGEYSQNAVILASKRIKRLSYRVDPSALRPWLHLRLREELRENPDDRKRTEAAQQRKDMVREKRKLLKRKRGGAAVRDAKRAMHESKKQAKARKVRQEVDKSMREAEAEVSREEREKWYGETLKQVFITYFRILKQKDNIGGLLPAVLEGLAKYAHLISVEFFVDLFHLLKKIMRGQHGVGIGAEDVSTGDVNETEELVSSRVSLRTSLLCILSAMHILTGQGEALNLDLKDFFYQLYALLPPLSTNAQIEATRMSALSDGTRYTVYLSPAEVASANAERIGQSQGTEATSAQADSQLKEAMWEETVRSESDLLFECLEMMFLGRTKVSSITRVASFCKRLAECALYWPPKTAKATVEFIHRLLIKYPGLDRLFSSEEQAGSGLFLKDLDDPDMCNPFATCLYEIHWLQIHYHRSVQEATARLLGFAKSEEKKHQI
ncbi:hypothetical protein IW140_003192 [Coemansia sp. RSA 1813]|nr:hypothetical protein EV178_003124 [Coemansia sp. RSA 1646]KAJ1773951.1 hypothetical protein LPJ74_000049 [Coemansia sp. RSA 1843]KAJ2214432.1 hypothetical protein EV179_002974 [Coemansia sp. RSA 487]KAJ2569346.1 hypothetical protein IW140_003192 [Coemansia sp. RSA 1813]